MRSLTSVILLASALPTTAAATDMTVFGIELGKALTIGKCPVPDTASTQPPAMPSLAERHAVMQARKQARQQRRADEPSATTSATASELAAYERYVQGKTYLSFGKKEPMSFERWRAASKKMEAIDAANRGNAEAAEAEARRPREGDLSEAIAKGQNAMVASAQAYVKGAVAPGAAPCVTSQPAKTDWFFGALEATERKVVAPGHLAVQPGEDLIEILLPDDRCPDWVKCNLYGVTNGQLLTALIVNIRSADAFGDDYVAEKLREKYGALGTPRQRDSDIDREWVFPELHVLSRYQASRVWVVNREAHSSPARLYVLVELQSRLRQRQAADARKPKL